MMAKLPGAQRQRATPGCVRHEAAGHNAAREQRCEGEQDEAVSGDRDHGARLARCAGPLRICSGIFCLWPLTLIRQSCV